MIFRSDDGATVERHVGRGRDPMMTRSDSMRDTILEIHDVGRKLGRLLREYLDAQNALQASDGIRVDVAFEPHVQAALRDVQRRYQADPEIERLMPSVLRAS